MRFLKVFALVVLMLAGWIALNSIDDKSYDDLGIQDKLKSVADEDNGYLLISYLNDPEYKMFAQEDSSERISDHVQGDEWDQGFVDEILLEKSTLLQNIEKAVQRQSFKFPDYGEVNSLPSFSHYRRASFLVLLKAKNYVKSGDFTMAIEQISIAIRLAHLVKKEECSTLVSYMVGSALHRSQALFIHQLLSTQELEEEELKGLQTALDGINEYHIDGFKKVFWGEYVFAVGYIEEEQRKTLRQRLEDYRFYKKLYSDETMKSLLKFFGFSGAEEYTLLRAFFPKYFFHMNKSLTMMAPEYVKLAEQADKFFKDLQFPGMDEKLSWIDALSPNSYSKQSLKEFPEKFKPFFERRCHHHVYFDAVRTIIAIHRYRLAHGEMPENLGVLVPNYLKRLPIDYFDGNTLRYSKDDGWLYSVGSNLEDNGGSSDGFPEKEGWRENPTIPLDIAVGQDCQ